MLLILLLLLLLLLLLHDHHPHHCCYNVYYYLYYCFLLLLPFILVLPLLVIILWHPSCLQFCYVCRTNIYSMSKMALSFEQIRLIIILFATVGTRTRTEPLTKHFVTHPLYSYIRKCNMVYHLNRPSKAISRNSQCIKSWKSTAVRPPGSPHTRLLMKSCTSMQ
jgi:hypothetical protein